MEGLKSYGLESSTTTCPSGRTSVTGATEPGPFSPLPTIDPSAATDHTPPWLAGGIVRQPVTTPVRVSRMNPEQSHVRLKTAICAWSPAPDAAAENDTSPMTPQRQTE